MLSVEGRLADLRTGAGSQVNDARGFYGFIVWQRRSLVLIHDCSYALEIAENLRPPQRLGVGIVIVEPGETGTAVVLCGHRCGWSGMARKPPPMNGVDEMDKTSAGVPGIPVVDRSRVLINLLAHPPARCQAHRPWRCLSGADSGGEHLLCPSEDH